jgi:hypothetical protein
MDTHDAGDLSELERRLSSWKPASEGLNTEAMLFAAGRAAGRTGIARIVWPVLACVMTVLAIGLGVWLESERTERQMLAQQLRQQSPTPRPALTAPSPAVIAPINSPATDELPPESFLVAHRALELGLDAWPPRAVILVDPSMSPNPIIIRVGQRDLLLDH